MTAPTYRPVPGKYAVDASRQAIVKVVRYSPDGLDILRHSTAHSYWLGNDVMVDVEMIVRSNCEDYTKPISTRFAINTALHHASTTCIRLKSPPDLIAVPSRSLELPVCEGSSLRAREMRTIPAILS